MIQSMPEGVDSKFRLALLVARRAEQLAAQEFDQGLVRWDYGPEGGVLEDGTADSAAEESPAEEEARV